MQPRAKHRLSPAAPCCHLERLQVKCHETLANRTTKSKKNHAGKTSGRRNLMIAFQLRQQLHPILLKLRACVNRTTFSWLQRAPAVTPCGLSSNTMQALASAPKRRAAAINMSGAGLPLHTSSDVSTCSMQLKIWIKYAVRGGCEGGWRRCAEGAHQDERRVSRQQMQAMMTLQLPWECRYS